VDIDGFLEAARARGLRIVAAVDTHAHADHASGGRAIAGRLDVPYRAPREAGPGAEPIAEGSGLRIGPAEIRAIATPGHTTGHVTLLFDHVAFTGDTLFLDSVGRPDLGQDARENAAVLWETLHRRILSLPDNTTILPAHFGDGIVLAPGVPLEDSLRDLKAAIPTLRLGREEFVDFVARGTDRPPANFQRIKAHNVGSARIEDVDEIRELEAGPNRCAVK
ncbi:MAG: MBL fold metallo-hydrolase, partial [Methanobacteriota archaeon]